MNATNPEFSSAESTPTQWMMKQLKDLSGALVSLQTKLDTELKHLPTRDDVSTLENDLATVRERTTHLATKADMNLLKGISSVIAVAAVSIAIKLIFFEGS